MRKLRRLASITARTVPASYEDGSARASVFAFTFPAQSDSFSAAIRSRFAKRKVFERDRWTCQHCGKRTPCTARGTNAHNQPELDHVLPMNEVPNSYSNTQCLCRECNGKKGGVESGSLSELWQREPRLRGKTMAELKKRSRKPLKRGNVLRGTKYWKRGIQEPLRLSAGRPISTLLLPYPVEASIRRAVIV